MIHNIKSDKLTVRINDVGAELISARGADGFEYVWMANPDFWDSHAPLLFPVCGRILDGYYIYNGKKYDMSCHGFASEKSFKVKSKGEDSITLVLEADEQTLSQYPFSFTLTASYTVVGDTLSASFTVENKDKKEMPYMFGWHPGFMLDSAGGSAIGDYSLKLDGVDKVTWFPLKNSEYVLNEEEIYANDTMIFVGTKEHALLQSDKEKHAVDFTWSENLPYFCIWKETDSNARFVCLEPWSDVPAGGDVEENFESRRMSRLECGKSRDYCYSVKLV